MLLTEGWFTEAEGDKATRQHCTRIYRPLLLRQQGLSSYNCQELMPRLTLASLRLLTHVRIGKDNLRPAAAQCGAAVAQRLWYAYELLSMKPNLKHG